MSAPYGSLSVANGLILRGLAVGRPLTWFQVHKLAILAHGLYLAKYGRPLIGDGVFAWRYGPMLPSLYAASPDEDRMDDKAYDLLSWPGMDETGRLGYVTVPAPTNDPDTALVLDYVFENYTQRSHEGLSELFYAPRTAWSQTRTNERISDALFIADFAPYVRAHTPD